MSRIHKRSRKVKRGGFTGLRPCTLNSECDPLSESCVGAVYYNDILITKGHCEKTQEA